MRLHFEPAGSEDIEAIFSLSRQLVDDYEDINSIPYDRVLRWMKNKIADSLEEYVRIRADGSLAGYYHLGRNEDGRLELDDFYILAPCRGKGIGTEVLKKVLAEAEEDVMLYVFSKNTGAVRLYERMGFVTEKAVSRTRRIMVWKKKKQYKEKQGGQ